MGILKERKIVVVMDSIIFSSLDKFPVLVRGNSATTGGSRDFFLFLFFTVVSSFGCMKTILNSRI